MYQQSHFIIIFKGLFLLSEKVLKQVAVNCMCLDLCFTYYCNKNRCYLPVCSVFVFVSLIYSIILCICLLFTISTGDE